MCTFFSLGASWLWPGMGPLKLAAEVHSTPPGEEAMAQERASEE